MILRASTIEHYGAAKGSVIGISHGQGVVGQVAACPTNSCEPASVSRLRFFEARLRSLIAGLAVHLQRGFLHLYGSATLVLTTLIGNRRWSLQQLV